MSEKTIQDVELFWNENPLWTGESKFQAGTREFFDEHKKVYYQDCFAGVMDEKIFPNIDKENSKVLDLGCGVGFWTIEFGIRGFKKIFAADLTENAIEMTRKRCDVFKIHASFSKQNAEKTTYDSCFFSHVNCQGVIHHTPNTEATVIEIHRILEKQGTASISVYYKNIFLRNWSKISWVGKILYFLGAGLKGRGRERIYGDTDINEIVRLYDGVENPIGKSYSKREFIDLLSPYFEIVEVYYHFFPARSLPFKLPKFIHSFLDKKFPFMIYANLKKK
ncbi:MAG: class I SAM-dependent methyltransferase [Oligoflexia bacterium]|nr:class I SAM-dependent methyltransferase [Oligoflexia bacterium]